MGTFAIRAGCAKYDSPAWRVSFPQNSMRLVPLDASVSVRWNRAVGLDADSYTHDNVVAAVSTAMGVTFSSAGT